MATAQANLAAAEAGVVRADADRTRWQSQVKRIGQLVAGGSLDRKLDEETQNSLAAAEAAAGEACAKVLAAKATLLQSGADLAKAKAAEGVAARDATARADLARVESLLGYTHLRAPYAGVVTERNVNRGDFVQPAGAAAAKPLVAVARADVVRIFVDVPEMDSPLVEPGSPGYVRVEALPDVAVKGKVTRTAWVSGPNRTLHTELDLPNRDGVLRPGMYATAHVVLRQRPHALVLPATAVVREGSRAYCWLVRDGRAARVPIGVGLQVDSDVEVTGGLHGDELVIPAPPAALHDGQPLELAKP